MPGEKQRQGLCFFVSPAWPAKRKRGRTPMFVVMASNATEAEVLGVKRQILDEGLTPFDHAGAKGTTIAVVGEIGKRKAALMARLGEIGRAHV